ncbi:MAG: hypothetical protein NT116_03985 [Candidatus Parcubacteria bacterium]|nr:hypothetical protein [Candidatus Parcubacteria bacterium]
MEFTREEIEKRMKADCQSNPDFVKFFMSEADRMAANVIIFGKDPNNAWCVPNCDFDILVLALQVIASELIGYKEKAEELLKIIQENEELIKRLYGFEK